jgi:hypothetical protein
MTAHRSPISEGHQHPANQRRHDQRSRGERLADRVTAVFGSWMFIVVQSIIVALWIGLNLLAVVHRWDPYPFIREAHGSDCDCVEPTEQDGEAERAEKDGEKDLDDVS